MTNYPLARSHQSRKKWSVRGVMPYIVSGHAIGGVGAILTHCENASAALKQARAFLSSGMHTVVIRDRGGHRIDGAALEACCRGEKSLTSDLRAT